MADVPIRHKEPPERPGRALRWHERRGAPFAVVGLAAAAVLGLGWLFAVTLDAYRARLTVTGLTDDPRPVALSIGAERLAIPANMIRFAATRQGGAVNRVDLALHWPALEGFSPRHAEAFTDGSPSAPIVYLTITPRDTALDAAARLDTVYARFFEAETLPGPVGLLGRRLVEDSGYGGEIVYFQPGAERPFVARCPAEATAEIPATCLSDFNLSAGLWASYRFNRERLGEWQALDGRIRQLVAGFLAKTS